MQNCSGMLISMDGYDNLIATLDYFEHRLMSQNPITTVSELARHSGYCTHHLSGLFTAHTDMKLKEYLQARILSTIFSHAYSSNTPLNQLALVYGFHDYETFYRACKRRFKNTPSNILQSGLDSPYLQQRIYPQRHQDSEAIKGEIIILPEFTLCGLDFFIWPETRSFHRHWQQFENYQNAIQGQKNASVTFQFTAWKEGEEQTMRVLCGLEVNPASPQETIFSRQSIPKTTYIRFLHTQDVSQIRNTYQYIYGTYFSQSSYQCLGNWELQRYEKNRATIEIYIPIRM